MRWVNIGTNRVGELRKLRLPGCTKVDLNTIDVCPSTYPIKKSGHPGNARQSSDPKPIPHSPAPKKPYVPSLGWREEQSAPVSRRYPSAHLIVRDAFARRQHCIVPARRFYGWKKVAVGKQPYAIVGADGLALAMAGLWERWKDRGTGDTVQTFTIITPSRTSSVAPSMIVCP